MRLIGKEVGLLRAIQHMVATCKKSYSQVSRELGKGRTYLAVMMRDQTTPRVDTLARIATLCGYELLLVGHGEALKLTQKQKGKEKVVVSRPWVVSTKAVSGSDVPKMVFTPSETMDNPVKSLRWQVSWNDLTGETEAEFAARDPEGYEEYRLVVELLASAPDGVYNVPDTTD